MIRLFKGATAAASVFDWTTTTLSRGELIAGVEFLVEGRDIVREPARWNGFIDLELRVQSPDAVAAGFPSAIDASDRVRMRMSPLMTSHHASNATTLFASAIPDGAGSFDPDSLAFLGALANTAQAIDAGGAGRTDLIDSREWNPSLFGPVGVVVADQRNQDYFETGYMAMPAVAGGQKVIRVMFRSPNFSQGQLRVAGRSTYQLRGPDLDPGAFESVARGHATLAKADSAKRGARAPIAATLRALGPRVKWALVEQVAFSSLPRNACTQVLSDALEQEQDPEVSLLLLRALSDSGNAWAWKTPLSRAKSEEVAVRDLAAKALIAPTSASMGGYGKRLPTP